MCKFKVSNQKAKFVPHEHEIYHRVMPYVIIFDVPDNFNQITGVIWSYYPGDKIRVIHARPPRKQVQRKLFF